MLIEAVVLGRAADDLLLARAVYAFRAAVRSRVQAALRESQARAAEAVAESALQHAYRAEAALRTALARGDRDVVLLATRAWHCHAAGLREQRRGEAAGRELRLRAAALRAGFVGSLAALRRRATLLAVVAALRGAAAGDLARYVWFVLNSNICFCLSEIIVGEL